MSTVFIVRRDGATQANGIIGVGKTVEQAVAIATKLIPMDRGCDRHVVVEQKVGTCNRMNPNWTVDENVVRVITYKACVVDVRTPPKRWEKVE